MDVSRWHVICRQDYRDGLSDAVAAYCGKNAQVELDFFDTAYELRHQLLNEVGACVAIGPQVSSDISDINLAAALARDGRVACMMLVRKRVSGSLMSRARQAGVNLVAESRAEGTVLYSLDRQAELGGDPPTIHEPEGPKDSMTEPTAQVPAPRKPRALEEGKAPIMVVASGRGGVGKTTIAGLLGLQAQAWGLRVALVDLDLAQGNLRAVMGVGRQGTMSVKGAQAPDLEELMNEAKAIEGDILMLGPCEKPEDAEVVAPLVGPLLNRISSEVDLVVVDTSNTVTDAVAEAMQMADRLLLVSDDMPGGLASLARLSGLAVRLGVARARIVRVINRCDPRQPPDLTAGRAEVGLEMARVHQLMEGGVDVCELEAEGLLSEVPTACRDLQNSLSSCLARLLSELGRLPDTDEAQTALEGGRKHKFLPFLRARREAS